MKVRNNYSLDKGVKAAMQKMAMRDGRSLSGFINWLGIKEADKRGLTIKPE